MTNPSSFEGHTIVACGTLRRELNHLRDVGFLDADEILYTAPGLHENLTELKKQLTKRLRDAEEHSDRAIVIYGDSCYLPREIDELLEEVRGKLKIKRIEARQCVSMLASKEELKTMSGGRKIYWLPTGWFEYRKAVFKFWDAGLANEMFPKHDAAIMLDALGVFEEYMLSAPEKILDFSDWMGIPLEAQGISLDRFKELLSRCV